MQTISLLLFITGAVSLCCDYHLLIVCQLMMSVSLSLSDHVYPVAALRSVSVTIRKRIPAGIPVIQGLALRVEFVSLFTEASGQSAVFIQSCSVYTSYLSMLHNRLNEHGTDVQLQLRGSERVAGLFVPRQKLIYRVLHAHVPETPLMIVSLDLSEFGIKTERLRVFPEFYKWLIH